MRHNEIRKDYLLDRWVVVATERSRRPVDIAKPKCVESQNQPVCPLCSGNEHTTPPAVLVYLPQNGGISKVEDHGDLRHKNWLVRVIPNLFPAFSPPNEEGETPPEPGNDYLKFAVGYHEVVVESPCHNDHPSNASLTQIVHVLNTYKDRLSDLASKPNVKYVQIFRNQGIEAGASLAHPHSQIIAMPFTPKLVQQEICASKKHWEEKMECVFCNFSKSEAKTGRLVLENEHFVVLAPYASVHSMEFWVIPKRHSMNLLDITYAETASFAMAIKSTFKALKDLVNDPPYNFGFHLSLKSEDKDFYHWHLEVYPRLTTWAGFEKSTGVYINTVSPEIAATELRKIINI
jgi:UDPglucose--hexose-1-phosphate uridylyltransferase